MAARTLTFSLTPTEFEHCRQELIDQQHIEMPKSNAGEVSASGVTVAYDYDGQSTLSIHIVHKPMLVPESAIVSRIQHWFDQSDPALIDGAD